MFYFMCVPGLPCSVYSCQEELVYALSVSPHRCVAIHSQSRAGVDLANVKMSMNPFCEIAVEEAIRLREKNIAKEVVAVTVGPKAAAETLRTALAMGADRAIHIETDLRTDQELQPLAVAKLFKFLTAKVRRWTRVQCARPRVPFCVFLMHCLVCRRHQIFGCWESSQLMVTATRQVCCDVAFSQFVLFAPSTQ